MRVNWAYDPWAADSIRAQPTTFYAPASPTTTAKREGRREPGKRTLEFERQRVDALSEIPEEFWVVLKSERQFLNQRWEVWSDQG